MTNAYMTEDEWYPVLCITTTTIPSYYATKLEFTDDEIERIQCAEIEFRSCQKLIADRLDSSKTK